MKRLALVLLLLFTPAVWATQYVVPDADITDDGWDSFSVCAFGDYNCLNDAPSPDDSDYGIEDDGDNYTMSGSSVTDPGVDVGFRLCMRIKENTGRGTAYCHIRIYDHDDNIIHQTGNVEVTDTSFYDYCEDIADASGFDATDYSGDWYFLIDGSTSDVRACYMSEIWMEVPDPASDRRVIVVH